MVNAILLTAAGMLNAGNFLSGPQEAALARRDACFADPVCPANNGQVCTSNGNPFIISCNSDFYGGDLRVSQTLSFTDCLTGCANTQGCVGVTYTQGNCYMKQALKGPVAKGSAVAASQTKSMNPVPTVAAKACPMNPTCSVSNTANDNCTYTGLNSRKLTLRCNRDFYGGDIGAPVYNDLLPTCLLRCVGSCVAVSWKAVSQGASTGTCYLKNTLTVAVWSDLVSGGYVNAAAP